MNDYGTPGHLLSRGSAEKQSEHWGQQERKGYEGGNLVCRYTAHWFYLPAARVLSPMLGGCHAILLNGSTRDVGTLLPRANAAACPPLAKADLASSSQHVREGSRIAALEAVIDALQRQAVALRMDAIGLHAAHPGRPAQAHGKD